MEIQSVLSNVQTFDELLPIAERSTPHISFLGKRYIRVEGFEGCLKIQSLVEKVEEIIARRPPWNERTRHSGKLVAREIERIDAQYNNLKMNSNWFSWILLFIRFGFFLGEGREVNYFLEEIKHLFDVTTLQFVDDVQYDAERGFKYLLVCERIEHFIPGWRMPDPARVRVSDRRVAEIRCGKPFPIDLIFLDTLSAAKRLLLRKIEFFNCS
ncbi:MAG: hypothetical protein PVI40_00480 [Chlamydiota bacterium]|jgi:hypothetical protein